MNIVVAILAAIAAADFVLIWHLARELRFYEGIYRQVLKDHGCELKAEKWPGFSMPIDNVVKNNASPIYDTAATRDGAAANQRSETRAAEHPATV